MTERRLLVGGYTAGFTNNLMSLELSVALAHLTSRVLVPYRFRIPRRITTTLREAKFARPLALIPHLFEIPVPWCDEYLEDKREPDHGGVNCVWPKLYDSIVVLSPHLPVDGAHFSAFANGRSRICTLSTQQHEAKTLHLDGDVFGLYSYLLYLPEAERKETIQLMSRVVPKQPYRRLAASIAQSFGRFSAIHLRRGDFVTTAFTPRATSVGGEEIARNLASRLDTALPLVICSDARSTDDIFQPIQRTFRQVIFLGDHLQHDPGVAGGCRELPVYDEGVENVLTQLIASYAEQFCGTLFSTFTARIHRLRGFNGNGSQFLYCYSDFDGSVPFEKCEFQAVGEGPFTWNQMQLPVHSSVCSWFREWPEAFG